MIVRYADDRDGRFRHNEFLRLAQAAFAGRRGHDPSPSLALPVRPGAARRPRVAWQNRIHLAAFPAIIGAYTAKEYCSCRYVMGTPRTIAGPIPNSTCRSAASSTTKPAAG